ncbi:MAG: helix-turn-helix domain-containing protein [Planctomycetota bacterium]|nr:helix-turn-helix domain-containing protein [Planctomycetota bacterium]
MKQIGARIRERRQALGLTQQGLADTLSVSRDAITKWEAGSSKPYESLVPLAEVLGVTIDWLLTGKESVPRTEQVQLNLAAIAQIEEGLRALKSEPILNAKRPAPRKVQILIDTNFILAHAPRVSLPPVPLIGEAAADEGEGRVYDPEQYEPGMQAALGAIDPRAITVRGDSAREYAREGQQAIIDAARQAEPGEPCLVHNNKSELRLKRKRPGKADPRVYDSINPDYPPYEISAREVIAEWPVVAVLGRTVLQSPLETIDEGPPPKKPRRRPKST